VASPEKSRSPRCTTVRPAFLVAGGGLVEGGVLGEIPASGAGLGAGSPARRPGSPVAAELPVAIGSLNLILRDSPRLRQPAFESAADGLDGGQQLLLELGGQRGVAGGRQVGLAGGRRRGQERLDGLGDRRVVALRADQLVGGQ